MTKIKMEILIIHINYTHTTVSKGFIILFIIVSLFKKLTHHIRITATTQPVCDGPKEVQ